MQTDHTPKLCECGCGILLPTPKYPSEQRRFILGHNGRKGFVSEPPNPSGLCQCGCGQKTKSASTTNSQRGWIKGEPLRYINGHNGTKPVRFIREHINRRPATERFWKNVNKRGSDECWEWTALRDKNGYGYLSANGKNVRAHRFSYELHNGPIPEGKEICHHCDNPPCCNPRHLFAGSRQDNSDDMDRKGRRYIAYGSKHHHAKLDEADVAEIRRCHREKSATVAELAQRFNMAVRTIYQIVKGTSWSHVK